MSLGFSMSSVDSERFRDWFELRKENIHDHVDAADVLSAHGVDCKRSGSREEQISCPFHGQDENPSARYYPPQDDSPSHVWCFACHKRWDAIGLWIEFTGVKFSEAISQIERQFHLETPKLEVSVFEEPEVDEDKQLKVGVRRILDVCENSLRAHRDSFDMTTHLKFGHLLDVLRKRTETSIRLDTLEEDTRKLSDKLHSLVKLKA